MDPDTHSGDPGCVDSSTADEGPIDYTSTLQEDLPSQSGPSRLFNVSHASLRSHYDVTSADENPLFYVDNNLLAIKRPSLIAHAGSSTQAPIVAVSKFLHLSRGYKIGHGDPQDPNAMTWEDLVTHGVLNLTYHFQVSIKTGSAFERRDFVWKKTRTMGAEGEAPSKWSNRHYKLVDEQTDQLIAVFTRNPFGVKRTGKIEIYVNYGDEFDLMVIMTILSIYEKRRRQDN